MLVNSSKLREEISLITGMPHDLHKSARQLIEVYPPEQVGF